MEDPICRRALAFARTFKYVNHRVNFTGAAPAEIVAERGTPESTEYGEVRIEMDWPPADVESILAGRSGEDAENMQKLLDAGMELRVICSATDVIFHDFVGVDFD